MDNPGYISLTRQMGLLREMDSVAQNLANMSTTGYRRSGVLFSEYVKDLGPEHESLSMAAGRARMTDTAQGALTMTKGEFDLAIEGDGFFLVATPDGERLTRAGHFSRSADGELVTPQGHTLLDAGGAAVFAPPDVRGIAIGADGTMSADGQPIAQIGLWQPNDALELERQEGVLFSAPSGVRPAEAPGSIMQGYLEASNVNPVNEITRMIEVQRAYELGQKFLDREDERVRDVIRTLGR